MSHITDVGRMRPLQYPLQQVVGIKTNTNMLGNPVSWELLECGHIGRFIPQWMINNAHPGLARKRKRRCRQCFVNAGGVDAF